MGWIVIRNWDRYQHYGDRQPPWIKLYVQLLHDDDFQSLSPGDRSVLIGLWMLYAMTRRRVRDNTAVLSRSIGHRVTVATLKRLNDAGFIDVSASKPLALEVEVEVEKETPKPPYRSRDEKQPSDESLESALKPSRKTNGGAYRKFDDDTPDSVIVDPAMLELAKGWLDAKR